MRLTLRLRAACLALALAAVFAAAPHAAPDVTLRDLRGVDELKTWFNANKGHVRLVLLLSPT
jgi:hypothetical protein